jgi:hypothetical protein
VRERDLVFYAALGIGAYFVWKKYGGAIGSAISTATAPLANTYVELTSPAAPVPQGSVLLPDGSSFPAANLSSLGISWQGNVLMFTYNGVQYSISSHDASGNYQAARV